MGMFVYLCVYVCTVCVYVFVCANKGILSRWVCGR